MTPKQKKFADEYLVDLNATQAAIRAGYSEKTAYSQGHALLKKPEITNLLNTKKAELARKTEITAEKVIQEIAKIAFANMQDYVDENNAPKSLLSLEENKTAAIQEVSIETKTFKGVKTVTKKLKMSDKLGALRDLGKHLGLFTEKIELEGKILNLDQLPAEVLQQLIGTDPSTINIDDYQK